METGFVGLGNMGLPMARNLLQAGHRLTVYNRTRGRAEELAKSGAQVASTPAAGCAHGVVMTVLSDDAAVESCVWGEGGILNALPKDGVHICLSTISTDLSRRLAEAHSARGQHFIAAPVFGRPAAAAAARLIVVAAGPPEAIERCRPLLEPLGRKVFVLGPDAPAAHTLKLAGNFLIASMLETLAEAFALLRKSNVDPAKLLEIVNGGLFQSPVYENYGRLMLEERFEPAGFALRLGLKDVRLVLRASETAAAPLPIASLIHDRLLSALARGQGDLDWSSLARVAAASAGLDR
ncbi:MAG: NAD(P)-dependent oxidoreductase [Acidobacteriia bacterium]|nr:NAD(P)-dependent oxidoreductase [Terriglobia bacterium]